MYSWLAYLTNICQLQILVMLWERYTCTNIGNLPVSHQVSLNKTLVKGMTNVCGLIQLRLVVAFPWFVYTWQARKSVMCGQSASFGTSHLQVHKSWECNHGDQGILKYECLPNQPVMKAVQSFGPLYSAQLLAHLSNTLVMGMQIKSHRWVWSCVYLTLWQKMSLSPHPFPCAASAADCSYRHNMEDDLQTSGRSVGLTCFALQDCCTTSG
jgi:hypothetical protein